LPNADEAAAATDLDAFLAVPPRPLDSERRVHVSRIFKSNEPELVVALIHLLHKMHRTPRDQLPLPLVVPLRRYPVLSEAGWIWQRLSSASLSYSPPHGNTKTFFLLQNYHGGGDGLVWLAASEKGNLCVLKFPRRTAAAASAPSASAAAASAATASAAAAPAAAAPAAAAAAAVDPELEAEHARWQQWSNAARILQFASRPALLMPFVFHARFDSTALLSRGSAQAAAATAAAAELAGCITFQGPNAWLLDGTSDHSPDVIEEDAEVRSVVRAYVTSHSPIVIARHAITQFLANGSVHGDLRWRHVALLPSKKKGAWQVAPILIDLTRVATAAAADTALARAWLNAAGLQRTPIPAVEQQIEQLQRELSARVAEELRMLGSK
jgi:hypothetical protein